MSQTKRMPLGIQQAKKKNENLISKNLNKNLEKELFNDSPTNLKVYQHKYNTRRNTNKEEPKIQDFDINEEKIGNIEYSKVLINCLKEAIEENEKLRVQVEMLTTDNFEMRNEIEEKNKVIEELYEYYESCKLNHTVLSPENMNVLYKSNRIQTKSNKKSSKSI